MLEIAVGTKVHKYKIKKKQFMYFHACYRKTNKHGIIKNRKIYSVYGDFEKYKKFTKNAVKVRDLTREQVSNLLQSSDIDYL